MLHHIIGDWTMMEVPSERRNMCYLYKEVSSKPKYQQSFKALREYRIVMPSLILIQTIQSNCMRGTGVLPWCTQKVFLALHLKKNLVLPPISGHLVVNAPAHLVLWRTLVISVTRKPSTSKDPKAVSHSCILYSSVQMQRFDNKILCHNIKKHCSSWGTLPYKTC